MQDFDQNFPQIFRECYPGPPRREGDTPLAPSPPRPMFSGSQYFRRSAATARLWPTAPLSLRFVNTGCGALRYGNTALIKLIHGIQWKCSHQTHDAAKVRSHLGRHAFKNLNDNRSNVYSKLNDDQFCSLAVLDPRVGHIMDVLSFSVLCHSDWLFHGESCLRIESEPDLKLKFRTLKNPRWRTAAILKNRKTAISPQQFPRSARNIWHGVILTLRSGPALEIWNC